MDGGHRFDQAMGVEEQVSFCDAGDARIFVCRHAPLTSATYTAVLCHPIDAHFHLSYRKLVLTARFLARGGIEVHRFHYRGTGNSAGEPEKVTFDSLIDDAVFVADLARSTTGVQEVVLIGAGWGGLVAAAAASRLPCSSLVLWQPVTHGMRYYKEAALAAMSQNAVATWTGPSRRSVPEELASKGSVDIAGYTVYRRLYETSKDRSLAMELSELPQPVLLIEPVGNHSRRREYGRLVDALALEKGLAVDRRSVGPADAEWFHTRYGHMLTDTARDLAKCVDTWLGAADAP